MRDFSDAIKFAVIRDNLEKNNGKICCEICGTELKSINEGHFDHIEPFAKGGKSIKSNCQLLCSNCNLKKNDKQLSDFLLDEKAMNFLNGISITETEIQINNKTPERNVDYAEKDLSKETFDSIIKSFIEKKGTINKVDFQREYNNLPSIKYVYKYYGDFSSLKRAFNLDEPIIWNRETIKKALKDFIETNGDFFQKDLKASNRLPSYPSILKYYPEYNGLDELKEDLFELKVRNQWTRDKVIEAGKKFVTEHGKITLKDMTSENGLPTPKVIYRYFGTMENFQILLGAEVSKKHELITMDEIDKSVEKILEGKNRTFNSRKDFFDLFPYSDSVIYRNYGSINSFFEKHNIEIKNSKKAKFTKQEIDDIIINYIKEGKPIPNSAKKLVSLGLPSRDAIMRYYQDWHEPFVLYSKLYEKIN